MAHPLEIFKFCPKCGSKNFEPAEGNSKKCADCGFQYFKSPTVGCAAFIFDKKGRMLAVRRSKEPAKGSLDLVGGFVDLGETIEQAMVREVKEETNIEIEVEKYLFCLPNKYVYSGLDVSPLDFFMQCKIVDMSKLELGDNENSEILFIEKDKINPDDFGLESVKKAIELYIKKPSLTESFK